MKIFVENEEEKYLILESDIDYGIEPPSHMPKHCLTVIIDKSSRDKKDDILKHIRELYRKIYPDARMVQISYSFDDIEKYQI